jgi:hypothetical protein
MCWMCEEDALYRAYRDRADAATQARGARRRDPRPQPCDGLPPATADDVPGEPRDPAVSGR